MQWQQNVIYKMMQQYPVETITTDDSGFLG